MVVAEVWMDVSYADGVVVAVAGAVRLIAVRIRFGASGELAVWRGRG